MLLPLFQDRKSLAFDNQHIILFLPLGHPAIHQHRCQYLHPRDLTLYRTGAPFCRLKRTSSLHLTNHSSSSSNNNRSLSAYRRWTGHRRLALSRLRPHRHNMRRARRTRRYHSRYSSPQVSPTTRQLTAIWTIRTLKARTTLMKAGQAKPTLCFARTIRYVTPPDLEVFLLTGTSGACV